MGINILQLQDPISDSLMPYPAPMTSTHHHPSYRHIVHYSIGRHSPVVSKGPFVIVKVKGAGSELDSSVLLSFLLPDIQRTLYIDQVRVSRPGTLVPGIGQVVTDLLGEHGHHIVHIVSRCAGL